MFFFHLLYLRFFSQIGSCGRAPGRSSFWFQEKLMNSPPHNATTTTINNQQLMHSHKKSNTTAGTAATTTATRNTKHQRQQLHHQAASQNASSPASMPAPAHKQITGSSKTTVEQHITSHGIKQHGNSVAASGESGSAFHLSSGQEPHSARTSRQNRGGPSKTTTTTTGVCARECLSCESPFRLRIISRHFHAIFRTPSTRTWVPTFWELSMTHCCGLLRARGVPGSPV